MKKALKIFSYIIISVVVFVGVLVVAASFLQKTMVDFALTKVSESVSAPIQIENLSFTFLKRFPLATFEFSGVKIGAENSSSPSNDITVNDELVRINHFYVSLKTIPFLKGAYEIVRVELEDANINYHVDSLGRSNVDFLMESFSGQPAVDTLSVESDSMPFVDLKKITLKDVTISYVDDSSKMIATLFIPDLRMNGTILDETYSGRVNGKLVFSDCKIDSTNLNLMKETTCEFDLEYRDDTLFVKSFDMESDGASVKLRGKVGIQNKIYTDLHFASEGIDLGVLVKYVPEEMLYGFGIAEVKGVVEFSGRIKGVYTDSLMPQIDMVFLLKDGILEGKDFPSVKNVSFDGNFTNGDQQNNATSRLVFNHFHILSNESEAELSFELNNIDKPVYRFKSKINMSLDEFKKYIPDSLVQNVSGRISGEFMTHGEMPDSIDDAFINLFLRNSVATIDFSGVNLEMDSLSIKNFSAQVVYAPEQLKVNHLNILLPTYNVNLKNSSVDASFSGLITQLDKVRVNFRSFHIESPQGKIWGSGKVNNLNQPEFALEANALLHLSELMPFVPDSVIQRISGDFETIVSTYGELNLDSLGEDQINQILFEQSKFKFVARNISVTMMDTLMKLSNFSGVVHMEPDSISISKVHGAFAGIDFAIDSASIVNMYRTVFKNQAEKLSVRGNVSIGAINHTVFDPLLTTNSSDSSLNLSADKGIDVAPDSPALTDSVTEEINYEFDVRGKIAVQSVLYDQKFIENIAAYAELSDSIVTMLKSYLREKIELENLSAKFKFTDTVYVIDQFRLDAFGGTLNSSLKWVQDANGKLLVNLKNSVEHVDVKRLLYDFNDFGPESGITHENLSGFFSASFFNLFVLNADSVVTKDMRMMGNMKLVDGGVYNYQPAMDMAKFTGIKELDNIEFKTLESNIFLFKNKMYVPKTNIVSTAMDISAYGMQSLGNDYEYHLQLHLGDVLKGKSKKLLEQQAKSGNDVSEDDVDRSAVKLIYADVDGNRKTGFDTKKAQQKMEVKIMVQQKMLDLIFHPTLVSFETGVK